MSTSQFSVASNFDNELIRQCKGLPVAEFYGKLNSDFIGGGRSSYLIGQISRRKFADHVSVSRRHNFGFNYLLNAACLNNSEITRSGQKEIRSLLDWVAKIGVTSTTVSNPLLLRIIKKYYPHLKVRVSVFAGVDHVQKAKYWQDIGADVICLDSLTVNRDFEALRSIRKHIRCELELLVNNNCLQSCSLSQCHMNLLAHSSQSKHANKGFVIDHCLLECSKLKMEKPVNYIKSDWIRPEDLSYYEEIGYHRFKIVERNLPTEVMMERVRAYSARSYEGNLLNLIQPYGQKSQSGEKMPFRQKLKEWLMMLHFLRPLQVKLHKLLPLYELALVKGMRIDSVEKENVYLDNKKLDGFIQRFLKHNCRNVACELCLHCDDFAQKSLSMEKDFQRQCLGLHQKIDKGLVAGEFFYKDKS